MIKYLIIMISIFYLFSLATTKIELSTGNGTEYTYYGIVPAKLYRYNLTDGHDPNSGWQLQSSANSSLLAILASSDGTNVKVYDLTQGTTETITLNSLERYCTLLANGTFFKVVSDKIVSVLLLDYQSIPPMPPPSNITGPLPRTFYTDVNGLYAGKEFVLMASQYVTDVDYAILAIEKSTVTVTRDDGERIQLSIDANSYKTLTLSPFRNYKITSTGNIMVQSGGAYVPGYGGDCHCFAVPAVKGGFVGTFFLTRSATTWDRIMDFGYRVSAVENTKVRVYDLDTKQLLMELQVKGGSGVGFKPKAGAIAVQSDKPISLSLVHNGTIEQTHPLAGGNPRAGEYSGYGEGITFIGVRPNEVTYIYLPVNAHNIAYFFASEDTFITIDDEITQKIGDNNYYQFAIPGTHKIVSDNKAIIQITHWNGNPEYQGIRFTGTIVPCVQTVNVNPTVTITPIEGGFPMTYIIMGAAAAVVAVIIVVIVMKKR
ncbi:MAG: hypothetical protein QXI71_03545 [Candidatus Bathyarchaeia archaeon]